MEDSDLISRILSGDQQALSRFYRKYGHTLMGHIRHKVDNPQDAEEIFSDTLMAFLDALRDFTGRSTLVTFLYSICNHKIIDYYRRKKIRHLVFSHLPQLEVLVSPLIGPEGELESRQLAEKIYRTFGKILPQYRKVLEFKYRDNLSVADIAEKMLVTVKSAESVLFRARKAFVKAFVSI